jgi:hypothetical protein
MPLINIGWRLQRNRARSLLTVRVGIAFIALIISSNSVLADDECPKWFQDSGIKPSDKHCEEKCLTLLSDMSTFMCNQRCHEFCLALPKCSPDKFGLKKIKDGRPNGWPSPLEKTVSWARADKEALLLALAQIPNELKNDKIQGIFRMQKSDNAGNPGSYSEGNIVLYDRAFNSNYSLARVIAHEPAHGIYENSSDKWKNGYRDALGWKLNRYTQAYQPPKNRKFVKPEGQDSPNEDFAINVDFYLFDPSQLKATTPRAFEWIEKHFSKKFKLQQECENENAK